MTTGALDSTNVHRTPRKNKRAEGRARRQKKWWWNSAWKDVVTVLLVTYALIAIGYN